MLRIAIEVCTEYNDIKTHLRWVKVILLSDPRRNSRYRTTYAEVTDNKWLHGKGSTGDNGLSASQEFFMGPGKSPSMKDLLVSLGGAEARTENPGNLNRTIATSTSLSVAFFSFHIVIFVSPCGSCGRGSLRSNIHCLIWCVHLCTSNNESWCLYYRERKKKCFGSTAAIYIKEKKNKQT